VTYDIIVVSLSNIWSCFCVIGSKSKAVDKPAEIWIMFINNLDENDFGR
jgi:hypothetical protein